MKFYIGSGMKNAKLVDLYANLLMENHWEQTYSWTKNLSDEESFDEMLEYATLELQGIKNSDVVIILLPAGRGLYIELGMALGLEKKIFLISNSEEEFNALNTVAFYALPQITKLVGNVEDNVEKILKR